MKNSLVFALIVVCASGCIKPTPACTTSPIPIYISIRNAQGADLFNTATPNNLDSNNVKIQFPPAYPTYTQVYSNLSRDSFFVDTKLFENWQSPALAYINFGNGDIDTITIRQRQISSGGCDVYEHLEFKYNNRVLTKTPLSTYVSGWIQSGYIVIK